MCDFDGSLRGNATLLDKYSNPYTINGPCKRRYDMGVTPLMKYSIRPLLFLVVLAMFSTYPAGRLYEPVLYEVRQPVPKRFKISSQDMLNRHGNKPESRFHGFIVAASNRHRVDQALVKAIIMAESNYDPQAVSKRGAVGLMQLMPRTADALGLSDYFNPEHNINAGVKYMEQLLNQYEGNIQLALAAYNAGTSEVRKHQGVPPNRSTREFVDRVLEYYWLYKGKATSDNSNV
jgi:hypothetical protein